MQLFVYEFISGGGFYTWGESTPDGSLLSEGVAMLQAIIADATVLSVDVHAMWDVRLPSPLPLPVGVQLHPIGNLQEHAAIFCELAAKCDFALLIAPECQHALFDCCRLAESVNARLVSPDSSFIALAGDKWAVANRWQQNNVPTPDTWSDANFASLPWADSRNLIVKPRDGAGSQGIARLETTHDRIVTNEQRQTLVEQLQCGHSIVQRWVPGRAASCSAICRSGRWSMLTPCWQWIDAATFAYLGGRTLECPREIQRAQSLARHALQALPLTQGYVGVDLVLGLADDGSQDWAIEVNPRLTTSYVGLRQFYADNLVAQMLSIAGAQPAELSPRGIAIQFEASI